MESGTNSKSRKAVLNLGSLNAVLERRRNKQTSLLVVRVRDFERAAWRAGKSQARRLESQATQTFADISAKIMREGDILAHDPASDVFVIALLAPPRVGTSTPGPEEVRSVLSRLQRSFAEGSTFDVHAGWTEYRGTEGSIQHAIDGALTRGMQEDERFEFFATVGHELRTPLSTLRAALDAIGDERVTADRRKEFLRWATTETDRLSRMIDTLYEISLFDLRGRRTNRNAASVVTALDHAQRGVMMLADRRGSTIRFSVEGQPRVAMAIDYLTQIFINLFENAIKHGRVGGRVDVAVREISGSQIEITIDDDGPGIPMSQRDVIFDVGRRGKTSTRGAGLGLSVVRMLVERAGGSVSAGESPNGGARFRVALKRARMRRSEDAQVI